MNIIKFIQTANKLKDVKRAGFVERGVEDPESVADHSFMMALMCMVLAGDEIDREKAIKMALVHDLAESEVGDLITIENWEKKGTISKKDKTVLERKAMEKILADLDPGVSNDIANLWDEFHEGRTPEAVFVKDLDNAERILQAAEYHRKGNFKKPLDGFWENWDLDKINNKKIKDMVLEEIKRGR